MLRSSQTRLSVLILYVVLVQVLGKYYSQPFLIFRSFDTLKFGLVLLGPIALNFFYFHWSWEEIGFRKPKIKAKWIVGIVLLLVVAPIFFQTVLQSDQGYLGYYGSYRQSTVPFISRLRDFTIFTGSTLIGWEVLHRSFLLFGLRNIWEEEGLNVKFAERSAILVVLGFEVLYHLLKPSLEAWGMIIFSPFLSWIAFRTRSIVIPLILHLFVEFLFFWSINS